MRNVLVQRRQGSFHIYKYVVHGGEKDGSICSWTDHCSVILRRISRRVYGLQEGSRFHLHGCVVSHRSFFGVTHVEWG
jgi:hypothetical protein